MTDPVLVQAPAALLSLPEVKTHLRVDHSHEDSLLEGYIAAAVGWMDGWRGVLHRCILTQTWAIRAEALEDMALPFPDVVSAVVTYLDAAGVTQTVNSTDYRVRTINGQGSLVFASGFSAPTVLDGRDDAVTVSAVYGFAEAPAALRVAALMLVSHWYQNREGAGERIPPAVHNLIAPWRLGLVG
jgi:uncharacterized phiE125 gp8 family phage protein